ncbi:MAG: prepilin-type N-terminal cleavage/methylation domain-containing protein [Dokdonella sp.]
MARSIFLMHVHRHSLPNRARMRGFSLIEMVAAFLIFAIGVGVLMNILATSMHSTRQSSDYTMAALWAESKLDTVGIGEPIEAGHSSGRFDDNYRWDLDIHQVDPSSVEPPPQQAPVAGNKAGAQNQNANKRPTQASDAGNGGGLEVAPFDIYQIDLDVSWGGKGFGSHVHNAHFGTLRVTNPDPDNTRRGFKPMNAPPRGVK